VIVEIVACLLVTPCHVIGGTNCHHHGGQSGSGHHAEQFIGRDVDKEGGLACAFGTIDIACDEIMVATHVMMWHDRYDCDLFSFLF
jgi:hypothetical protein